MRTNTLTLAVLVVLAARFIAVAAGSGAAQVQPANFTVTVDSMNDPVDRETGLTVDTTVENTGGTEGTQTVTLDVGALGSDSTQVTLNAGESTTETLTVSTNDSDSGLSCRRGVSDASPGCRAFATLDSLLPGQSNSDVCISTSLCS